MGWKADGKDVALRFSDERLGNGLDALFWCEGGLPGVNSALTIGAIKAYELATSQIHIDLTSNSTYGRYARSKEPEEPESPFAIPYVTYGRSKAHRSDLKQILFGLGVTSDGGVPLVGRSVSGNRGEAPEMRYLMDCLARMLPDPTGSTLVGDCKLFAGETLLLAKKHGFHYVTLVPHSVGIREEAFVAFEAAKARGQQVPLLRESAEYDGGPTETWSGLSFPITYQYKDDKDVVTPIAVRALVVESSSLRKLKLATLTRQKAKEREALEKASRHLRQRKLANSAKALEAAGRRLDSKKLRFHKVAIDLVATSRPVKRGRGRPRKGEEAVFEKVWSTALRIEEDAEAFKRLHDRESCFILASDRLSTGADALTDPEMLGVYKGQHRVESCFKTSKGPLVIAPLLLKTPERLAALTLVYVVALMVYTLIQRETRARLAAAEATIPGNKGDNAQPTTEVALRLMEGIESSRSGEPGALVHVTKMTTAQARLLELLDHDVLRTPSLIVDTPSVPFEGQLGYRPPVRTKRPAPAPKATRAARTRGPRKNPRRRVLIS
jgi:transposase